jgi:flavin reductase (DIM6/NTAB) family NADH-FMN oxidoreductase RutF
MKEIAPKSLNKNTFSLIGDEWMLITASNGEKVNTMTASWGGLGVFCNKEVAFTFIRPQRYTKEFVDCADTFSLSVLGEKYRDALTYLGRVSGKDEDKIAKSGLTVSFDGDTPYFEDSEVVIICKKMCEVELEESSFSGSEYCDKFFPSKDFHTLYVSEIIKVMVK